MNNGRLVVGLREGRRAFIGRDIEMLVVKSESRNRRAFVSVTAPKDLAISRDGKNWSVNMRAFHLYHEQAAFLGRAVKVHVIKVEADGFVRIAIEAPKHMAISRDDVTFEKHLEFCQQKEGGSGGQSGTVEGGSDGGEVRGVQGRPCGGAAD